MCPCALHSSASGDPRSSRLHSADMKPSLFKPSPTREACTLRTIPTYRIRTQWTGCSAGRAAEITYPAWKILPGDRPNPYKKTTWSLDGCPLGKNIIIRPSGLSSHAKMRHQHLTQ